MQFSKDIHRFAYHLVSNYSTFDKLRDCYSVATDDVPDYELFYLISQMIAWCPELAKEALGSDNPLYESHIEPALTNYLKDITNKDNEVEYLIIQKNSMLHYFENMLFDLLQEALAYYNENKRHPSWAA